jgi:broad specificity phosphatase PhoE
MRKLVLVRHAMPIVRADVPSEAWALSPAGRDAAAQLGERLRAVAPTVVISSPEPKAYETVQIVSSALSVPLRRDDGLREHRRRTVPLMAPRDFERAMAAVFERSDELVLGEETDPDAQSFGPRLRRAPHTDSTTSSSPFRLK